ncbi:isoprenoid biosynthetic process [Ascochyta rabiei]|uniref:Isoprenoid biosynthetic process n=1 Tax=Didymella rabiei TaxID=5454 RepID=A0A163LFS1_DIDRA|nr:isoprenoid biosynthetic process [Ascochyta rabiei]
MQQSPESEYLASYSWLESEVPTILVPGFPSLWSPPAGPLKLEPDSGRVYVDKNAARIPDAPLKPLFSALSAQNPGFEMGSVDVITDRNNIKKLLRFLDGTSSESFQMQVEIVDGKMALFTRTEDETTTVIQGFRVHGRNFKKACTKSATGTSGYHRITSFSFGGLQCVVRHETDGYIDDALGRVAVQKQAKTTVPLLQLLETLQLTDSASAPTHTSTIAVKREGKEVDCSSILEVKTRAAGKSLDMNETAAQLWISQTPHLAVGYIELVKQKKAASEGVDAKWQGGKQGTEDNKLMTKKGDQYKTPAQTGTTSRVKTPITIGNVRCETDVSRIPRLASPVLNSGDSSSQLTEIIHEAIPLFDVALKGIESGYRQCFRSMSSDITLYRTLCDTYDFLHVDVYTFQSNDKHKNTIFNAVLFVVSHPGTFKWKTRNAVRAVYESRLMLSVKQRVNLDRWHELDSSEQTDTQKDDVTTEEENLDWYDSDYSDSC